MADLEGVNQRIDRAEEHLNLLKTQVRNFVESGKACTATGDKDGEILLFEVAPQSVPQPIIESAGEVASSCERYLNVRVSVGNAGSVAAGSDAGV